MSCSNLGTRKAHGLHADTGVTLPFRDFFYAKVFKLDLAGTLPYRQRRLRIISSMFRK
jgi:hypothetical protein